MLCQLVVVQAGSGFNIDTNAAEAAAEAAAEVATKIAAEVLVVRLDQGVRNLVYRCVEVQAGSGFDIDTSVAPCLTVAER